MANALSKPEMINKLRFALDAGFAMLAGMQLDLFTALKSAPMTAEQLAATVNVSRARLRFLRYVFVAGELYTESEHREWLTAAGFVDIDHSLLADGGSLITARKLK